MELLAPAGNMEKLKTALHFGADAVYVGGKNFSLRAYADNFDDEQLRQAVRYTHGLGKKIYVAVNIFPTDEDFEALGNYVVYLQNIGVDAAIVTDPGLIALSRMIAPDLPIHISTQANVTNGYTAAFWAEQGASRIVLARELTLQQIAAVRAKLPRYVGIECFVHGAMCISYSGRCLLSSYLTDRDSNRGECVQACRWQYRLAEASRPDSPLSVEEDDRGSYILNSRDMNMIAHLADLRDNGVDSLKIEGRMKTAYYVATVVNAYRRALDFLEVYPDRPIPQEWQDELYKCNNRSYCTGFYYGKDNANVCYERSQAVADYEFVALVLDWHDGMATVEQRNRFAVGEELEILSPGEACNKRFVVSAMQNEDGEQVDCAKLVQQRLRLPCKYALQVGDILRRRK